LRIKCVVWFSLPILYETFLILRRIQRGIITHVQTDIHIKYPLFLSDFNQNLIFFDRFSRNPQITIFIAIHPVRAELFHAERRTDEWTGGGTDGQTDIRRLTVVYRSFANTPKNWSTIPLYSSKSILIHIQIFTVDRYFQIGHQSRL